MNPAMNEPLFPQPVLDVLARHPDRVAIEHGPRMVTNGELLVLVQDLVATMAEAGVGPGRGVAMLTGTTPEAFAANLAAHARGGRIIGIRPGWGPQQLARAFTDGADAVVGDASTLTPELVAAAAPTPILSLGPHPAAIDLLAGTGTGGPVTVVAQPDDVARFNFTSGSSGQPKGCARSYRTFSRAYRSDLWSPDLARLVACMERFLLYLPLSMPVLLTFAGRALLRGGTVVIPPDDARPALAYAIARHRITGVTLTPPSLHQMLALLRDDPLDVSSLRAVVVSGSPASPSLLAGAVEQLGPVVWQGYGQAESGMISLLTPEDIGRDPDQALASVGRVLPEVELTVRDPDDRPLARGESGEICVRSPHVMDGYWRAPELTDEVVRDGWLHTRDLGWLDADGRLRLTGRSRDVILVNAEVCYAGAIEQVLVRHPDVEQAYVVGIPDERTGESVHAFVVTACAREPDVTALVQLVKAELTPNHVPETVTALDAVPLGPGGKPDKVDLLRRIRQP